MHRTYLYVALMLLTASGSLLAQTHQHSVQEARDLFYAAAYEQALLALDRIEVTSVEDATTVEQYRAACLLALGRASEADEAFERLVAIAPDMTPDELELAPSLRMRFAAVRGRVIRGVEQQRQAWDLVAVAPLAVPSQPEFCTIDDRLVSRPFPLSERVPDPPRVKHVDFTGSVIVHVDIAADGTVEAVTLLGGIHPAYDAILVEAARKWRYLPATLNGQPVKFRKALKVDIS
jgi:TonB family protein